MCVCNECYDEAMDEIHEKLFNTPETEGVFITPVEKKILRDQQCKLCGKADPQEDSVYDGYENFEKTMDGLVEKLFDTPDGVSIVITPAEKEILRDDKIELWDYYDKEEQLKKKSEKRKEEIIM